MFCVSFDYAAHIAFTVYLSESQTSEFTYSFSLYTRHVCSQQSLQKTGVFLQQNAPVITYIGNDAGSRSLSIPLQFDISRLLLTFMENASRMATLVASIPRGINIAVRKAVHGHGNTPALQQRHTDTDIPVQSTRPARSPVETNGRYADSVFMGLG